MSKVNYKRYLLYLACNIFAIMFLFLFYSISFNQVVEEMKKTDSFDTLLAIPSAALILFMLFFILYSHQMFIKNRKNEFGIFMAIGMSPKNIARILITESFFISILALVFGLIGGSIFSKLFFVIFSYFTKISPEFFHISFKMISFTILVYVILFWSATIFSIFQIRSQTLLSTIQSNRVIDLTKTNKTYFGYIGIALIVFSIMCLYVSYPEKEDLIFIWALFSFFGLYLFLSNGIHTMIALIKKFPNIYYPSLLLTSSIEQKQKKLTSLLTLVSTMVMITTLYCTLTLGIAKYDYDSMLTNYPSDIAYNETEQYNRITKEELYTLFEKENSPISKMMTIPSIEIAQEEYYGTSYLNVISLDSYNQLTNKKIRLSNNECILFFNMEQLYDDLDTKELFEIHQFKLTVKDTKIERLLSNISQSSTFIVINDKLWEQLKNEFPTDLYYQQHIHVADWKNSLPALQQLKDYFEQYNPLMTEEIESILDISSKIEVYTSNKTGNAILFYVMIFLSFLFYFGMFILLYLNLMSDIDLERTKFDKLNKIGITKKEIKRQLNSETFILFFLPTFLGIGIAFWYVVSMAKDIGGIFNNLYLLLYFILMSPLYLLLQFCFFVYAKSKLFTKVWHYLHRN